MSYKKLTNARKKTVGAKQTLKALHKGHAKMVFIAKDAERHVVDPIINSCQENNVPIIEVENMKVLGKACKIEVGCAAAAIIEE